MSGNYVRKTSADVDGLAALLEAISGGEPGHAIEASEAAGQRQLVASDVIPSEMGDRSAFEALGFTFGETVRGDDLFIECTLPEGWSKEGSDHAMWSYIVDQLGRRRVACFYKAAFYDRRAFSRLESPESYLRSVLYGNGRPVMDDGWLTRDTAVLVLNDLARECDVRAIKYDQAAESQTDRAYWEKTASEERAEAVKIRNLLQVI